MTVAMQGAIKTRQPFVELMGRTVDVNCNAGIFVTMNPAGKGVRLATMPKLTFEDTQK